MTMRAGRYRVQARNGPSDGRASSTAEPRDRASAAFRSREGAALTWMQLAFEPESERPHGRLAVNILRRLPLSRLLLLCALVVAIGVSATALAFALGSGPDAAAEAAGEGRPRRARRAARRRRQRERQADQPSARRRQPRERRAAKPAKPAGLQPAAGRRLRTAVDLQGRPRAPGAAGRKGRHAGALRRSHGDGVRRLDATPSTATRRPPRTRQRARSRGDRCRRERPRSPDASRRSKKRSPSSASTRTSPARRPTDIAGQPAYTVRVSPKESGSLIGGAELSWDAVHGVPLRAALYSSTSTSPVIELAASEVSYGPVASSVFELHAAAEREGRRSHAAQQGRHRQEHPQAGQDGGHAHPKVTTPRARRAPASRCSKARPSPARSR